MPRLAWAGTGHIHTPAFAKQSIEKGFTSAGVWDPDSVRAAKYASELGCTSQSVEALAADSKVDGYVICSETVHHLDLVSQLAPTGKPLFIEKPMGFNGAQSGAILELLQKHGNIFQTGYMMRGDAKHLELKKRVDEGFFGSVTRVRASCCHSGALGGWFDTDYRWMADRSQAGVGAFGDLGTHVLDQLMWMFGDIVSVTATMSNGTARYEGCEEIGEALLIFKSGVIGTLAAAWDDVADPIRLQVAGTKGHATVGVDLLLAGTDGKFEKVDVGENVTAGFSAFLEFLEGKTVELVKPEEAVKRDKVMDAIYRAAESRVWVDV
ncbi:MAG TPA: Gfo/Idh/MocA family oxidoreductase [Fimbriimonadaceae bacterium]|jgi:predicted dehydrogenase